MKSTRSNFAGFRLLLDALEPRCYLSAISFGNHVDFTTGTNPDAIVAADFNNDGNMDIAVADATTDQVSIFYGNGQGSFTAGPVLKVNGSPTALIAGDFNNDGDTGLAVGCEAGSVNAGTTVTVFNNDAGTFALGLTTTVFTGATANEPIELATGFFNNDNILDLAATEFSGNSVAILLGVGNGTFQTPVPYQVDNNPTSIVAADFNGDGKTDLAVADTDTITNSDMSTSSVNAVTFLSGNGDGTFTVAGRQQLDTTAADVLATADLNNDGKPDLIVASADSTADVFLNNGKFQFTESDNFALAGPGSSIAAADFNFDGDTDLVFASGGSESTSVNEVSIATGAGDGTVSTFSDAPTGQEPVAVVAADFNNDGKPDLAVADEGGGQVSILLNTTVGTVVEPTTTALQSSDYSAPYGQSVNFTAFVSTTGAGADVGTPGGSVEFFDGSHLVDTETLDESGQAVFSTSSLNVGTQQIYAQYVGNSSFAASTSNSVEQTITPSAGHGPDLIGSFIASTVPSIVVPGEKVNVKVRVTNQGNTIAQGSITNDVYLSLDDTLDPSDILIPLTGPLALANVKLKPNASIVYSGSLTIPTSAPNADYILLADINDTQTLLESDYSNNVAVSPSMSDDEDAFGVIGGHSTVLTLPDADGTNVTYKLSGPGLGTVNVGDDGIDVSLTGTTAASALTITGTGGNGFADLNSITSDGSLASIQGPKVNLASSLTLGGAARKIVLNNVGTTDENNTIALGDGAPATISLGSVVSTVLTASSGINSLTVASSVSSSLGPTGGNNIVVGFPSGVRTPWIGSLTSKGDFDSFLMLSGAGAPGGVALRQATIHGNTDDPSWQVTGSVGKISILTAAPLSESPGLTLNVTGQIGSFQDAGSFSGLLTAANIGLVTIDGDLNGNILAGADPLNQSFVAGSINSLRVDGSITSSLIAGGLSDDELPFDNPDETLIPGGRIKSLFVGGSVDANSKFLAESLPPKVQIGGTTVTPAADPHFQI